MKASGFKYIGKGDTARCDDCGLEVSQWTPDMYPLTVHSTQKPDCPFIRSLKSSKSFIHSSCSSSFSSPVYTCSSPSTATVRSASISNEQENPSKRQKIETSHANFYSNNLFETDKLQQIRKRTFSHWPHRTIPSQAQMIEAGFFNCNVGDRVICIYCNLICQQWTPHTDDPCEVHKTLSPNCMYVKTKLIRPEARSILIVNETTVGAASGSHSSTSNNNDLFRCNEFVPTAACHNAYTELPRRTASFATWPNENLPSVEDLVRAGFFYTGTKSIVTCFYCNGSLQNWGPNDNPMIEHARWFPHCAYAKQLCGVDLYRKIQESKRAQQERARGNESKEKVSTIGMTSSNATSNSRQLLIPDESTLSRLVAARLDLPISQSLLAKNFKLSIIKRCWEDQLRLKQDDFVSDSDLHMACTILQKQIERIDGKKENIIIPSIKMKKIREDAERERAEALARQQAPPMQTVSALSQLMPTTSSNIPDVEMITSSQSPTTESTSSIPSSSQEPTTVNQEETKITKPITSITNEKHQISDSSPVNPCVLCLTEEKRLACIPCGHLATCVPCGHSLRSCPICRREIEAFVRIYI
ncbi:unnamed protein product [Rotaria sp. Silwood2]|nr:unnamed protein product [Rotaria sp. Silwood2]CAF2683364.1 unnamed protein product [Rotaria sp. Silwood2]CAF2922976.1 unnamed protein product [Rotaria sp. Silwood2]CAF3069281.1 unnamed protein product [Rotaria sp. Silwood2]CAF3985056.1 unnamed protein product [Rotaria sp. Silwood2]